LEIRYKKIGGNNPSALRASPQKGEREIEIGKYGIRE